MAETTTSAPQFIDDAAALAAFCAGLEPTAVVAFDTEFERSRTYFAELCLVQVACGDALACIDTLALQELAPLAAALTRGTGAKVVHAARQDLEVLQQRTGSLACPLFDTQIAAALCGHPEQIGYADLVRIELGIELAKTATRTDWRQRPLSAEQLAYAADDVRYLAPLAAILEARLHALGRRTWLDEDCAALLDPALYQPPVTEAWTRLKSLSGLPPAARSRAAALANWREQAARTHNLPRNWVVKDAALYELAGRAPADLRGLAELAVLEPGTVRRHGQAILAAMANAGATPPVVPGRLTAAGRAALQALTVEVQARAAALGISPAVLATRAELEAVLCGRPPGRLRNGWRAGVLGIEFGAVQNPGALCEC